MKYFSSDYHLFHARIIELNARPFKSMQDMVDAIVKNYNEYVDIDDDMWILGDFAFYKADGRVEAVFNRLNGRKHLIIGNHDCDRIIKRLNWDSVAKEARLELRPGVWAHLSHCPIVHCDDLVKDDHAEILKKKAPKCCKSIEANECAPNIDVYLHGHIHSNQRQCLQNCFDVGVDACDFKPVSAAQICEMWENETRQLLPLVHKRH